ncbi:MAG: MgtC/SapB family protein [Faecalimonas sp.]|nr:MgtC/SapB family protein [Faecalimonas sp.]
MVTIDFLDWTINFHDLGISVFKIALALICAGVIGIERGRKKRPAGFRTYMVVCVGATLVMMTNEYLCEVYGTGDVARLGAQVINGIGFLGAGTIITTGHNRVKGLTTAAGLWTSACIGLAIGSGYYEGAILGTLAIVIIMVVLHSFDRRLTNNTKAIILYVEFTKMSVMRKLVGFARENDIKVEDVEIEQPNNMMEAKMAAVVTLRLPNKENHLEFLEKVSSLEGVMFVEEI